MMHGKSGDPVNRGTVNRGFTVLLFNPVILLFNPLLIMSCEPYIFVCFEFNCSSLTRDVNYLPIFLSRYCR